MNLYVQREKNSLPLLDAGMDGITDLGLIEIVLRGVNHPSADLDPRLDVLLHDPARPRALGLLRQARAREGSHADRRDLIAGAEREGLATRLGTGFAIDGGGLAIHGGISVTIHLWNDHLRGHDDCVLSHLHF